MLVNMGWLKLCGAIAMAQGHHDGVETSIWDHYQVCCKTREQWLGPHAPEHYDSISCLWALDLCKNLIYL